MRRKIGATDRIVVGGKSSTVGEYLAAHPGPRRQVLRGLLGALKAGHAKIAWDESKHPRDDHGRFTDVNGNDVGGMQTPFPESSYGMKAQEIVRGQIKSGIKPKVVPLRAKDFRALRNTQAELKPFGGDDDEIDRTPLFTTYAKHPVVLEGNDGNYHVLDGHNRISAAVRDRSDITVFLFREWAKAPPA